MTEAYIHFLWKLKRLPFHQFKSTDNKELMILKNGIHNATESGPDFFNSRILHDGIQWVGQIEIHIKSSDWYKHKHHSDNAYNNVILHVVYEHDKEVYINGRQLLTLELKHFIDDNHYKNWLRLSNAVKSIPCDELMHNIDPVYLKMMMHQVLINRFDRKALFFSNQANDENLYNSIYRLFVISFGMKVNALPFELLTNQLPISILKKLDKTAQKELILKTSGLFPLEENEVNNNKSIGRISPSIWKRKGLRPTAFPEIRILQFTDFVMNCDFELLSEYKSPQEAYEYTKHLIEKLNNSNAVKISESLMNHLFVNTLLPFYWYKAIKNENEELFNFVISFLETIPSEENTILKKWKSIGVTPSNSFESQALIELYNEYCLNKKCLNCQVGVKLLNNV